MHERLHRWYLATRNRNDDWPWFFSFGANDQMIFVKRLAVYLSSGVPILEALSLLHDDAHGGSRYVLKELIRVVSEGRTLSSGFRLFPRYIKAFSASLIEIGERSGTLQESLSYLAIVLRKERSLKRKLIGTLTYPAIIITATIGICLFLVLYAFPKIVPLFRDFGATLPFPTRTLIFLSDSLSSYGLYAIVILVIFSGCIGLLMRNPHFCRMFDRALLYIPVFGSLVRNYYLSSLSRTLSTLLLSGVGIVPALELASTTTRNQEYGACLLKARDRVLAGERISIALLHDNICFPRMYIQMISTGESTGSLSSTFNILAEHHEEEFDTESTGLTSLIEPTLMILMGITVGFIALAIITPVYQITQGIHG